MNAARAALQALLLACPLALAAALGAEPGDEQAVRDLVGRYAAARESRDPAAIRSLFAEDADQLVSSGVWRRGRETLVEGMLASSRSRPGSRSLEVETVRFPLAAVALADARYVIKGSDGNPDRRMWSTFLCVQTGAGWKISAIRNMLPAPR